MTLPKCYIDIGTLQTEAEIRESITEVKCCILTSVLYYMYMTLASYSFLKLGKTHVSGLIFLNSVELQNFFVKIASTFAIVL